MVARLSSILVELLMHIIHDEIQEKGRVVDMSCVGIDVQLNNWLPPYQPSTHQTKILAVKDHLVSLDYCF